MGRNLTPRPPAMALGTLSLFSQPASPRGSVPIHPFQTLLGMLTEWMDAAHLKEWVSCDRCFTKVTSISKGQEIRKL